MTTLQEKNERRFPVAGRIAFEHLHPDRDWESLSQEGRVEWHRAIYAAIESTDVAGSRQRAESTLCVCRRWVKRKNHKIRVLQEQIKQAERRANERNTNQRNQQAEESELIAAGIN